MLLLLLLLLVLVVDMLVLALALVLVVSVSTAAATTTTMNTFATPSTTVVVRMTTGLLMLSETSSHSFQEVRTCGVWFWFWFCKPGTKNIRTDRPGSITARSYMNRVH
jgi:hypothetical protein